MKMATELVISDVFFYQKAFLLPTTMNTFGSLMFPMNTVNNPGALNPTTPGTNTYPLANTTTFPKYMGSTAQSARYTSMLVTASSISITIKVKQPAFYHTGTVIGVDTVYEPTVSNLMYFCLVPYNSSWIAGGTQNALNLMPWAQVIRQPGARRMALSGMDGKSTGTLRGYCNIGKIEGTPSWETDTDYRCESGVSTWTDPGKTPMWMLYAYYPYGSFTPQSPAVEMDVKLTQHATFFLPKIATLYTALSPVEQKGFISDSKSEDYPSSEPTPEEMKDDDDPALIEMSDFRITTPSHPSSAPILPVPLSRAPSISTNAKILQTPISRIPAKR